MPIGKDHDSLGNYAYQIEIDGITIGQFKEVSGLNAEIQPIEFQQNKPGGIPVMTQLPGKVKWGPITLKQGTTNDKTLWQWMQQVREGKIDEARRNGSIVLYSFDRGEQLRINFRNGWPSKLGVSNLDASGNQVAITELNIVHEGLEFA